MVFDLNCSSRNIPQSSTSSCTDLLYEASNIASNKCGCQRCRKNSMINDHTYSVLKRICRKIIRDFNRQQCREKYTIFDGGNSVNVRVHRSSSLCVNKSQPESKVGMRDSSCLAGSGRGRGRSYDENVDSRNNRLKGRGRHGKDVDDYDENSKNLDKKSSKSKKQIENEDNKSKDKKQSKSKKQNENEDKKSKGKKNSNDDEKEDGKKSKSNESKNKKLKGKKNLETDGDSDVDLQKKKSKSKRKNKAGDDDMPIISNLRQKVRKGQDVTVGNKGRGENGMEKLGKKKKGKSANDLMAEQSENAKGRGKAGKGSRGNRKSLPNVGGSQRLTKDGKDRYNGLERNGKNGRNKYGVSTSNIQGGRNSRGQMGENGLRILKRTRCDEARPCDYLRANMEQREAVKLCSQGNNFPCCDNTYSCCPTMPIVCCK